jgi:hypothetical protein
MISKQIAFGVSAIGLAAKGIEDAFLAGAVQFEYRAATEKAFPSLWRTPEECHTIERARLIPNQSARRAEAIAAPEVVEYRLFASSVDPEDRPYIEGASASGGAV